MSGGLELFIVCLLSRSMFRNPLAICAVAVGIAFSGVVFIVENHTLSAGGFLIIDLQIWVRWMSTSVPSQCKWWLCLAIWWQSKVLACEGPVIAIISTLCVFLKKSSCCLWSAILLASGQCLRVSVVTFSQFGQRNSHLAQI